MNGVAEFLHYYITQQHIQHFTLYARPGAALRALQQTVGATLRALPGIDARVEIVAAPDLYVNRLAVNQQLDAACYRDQVQWQTKCGTRALPFDIDWVVDLDYDELLYNARDRRTLPTLLQSAAAQRRRRSHRDVRVLSAATRYCRHKSGGATDCVARVYESRQ
jgi:hypothetical protein